MTASAFVALLDGGKREETVRVTQEGPGLYVVELRGKRHQVDAFRHDHGTVSLIVDEQSFSVQLDQREAGVRVWIRGDAYPLELLDERHVRMRRASGALTASGRQALTVRVPGRVVKVRAKVGAAVRAGQALVVVEALGMENELASPRDGTVVELHAAEGQPVEAGATLAVVE